MYLFMITSVSGMIMWADSQGVPVVYRIKFPRQFLKPLQSRLSQGRKFRTMRSISLQLFLFRQGNTVFFQPVNKGVAGNPQKSGSSSLIPVIPLQGIDDNFPFQLFK